MHSFVRFMLLLALLAPTMADEERWARLSGFGTLSATRTDDPAIGFKRNFQARAKRDAWTFETDSSLGLQLDLALGRDWQGVVQVVGMQRETGDFEPQIDWANLAWQANPNWRLRLGRMVTPVTSSSESREVGYAQLSVRAPVETIGIYPMISHDGADVRYRQSLGEGELRAQGFAGGTRFKLPFLEYTVDQIYGVALSYAWNDWTLRYAHTEVAHARATGGSYLSATQPLLDGLAQIEPYCASAECSDTINRIQRFSDNWGSQFNSVSLSFDDGTWNVLAEYALRRVDTFISDGRSLVLLAGYRRGDLTPYLGYGRLDSLNRYSAVSFPVSQTSLQAGADALAAAVSRTLLRPQAVDRKVYTLGLRWDIQPGVALTAQLDEVHHRDRTAPFNGFYERGRAPDGSLLPYDGKVRLYSIAADFVF